MYAGLFRLSHECFCTVAWDGHNSTPVPHAGGSCITVAWRGWQDSNLRTHYIGSDQPVPLCQLSYIHKEGD